MDYYMRICKWFLIRNLKYVVFLAIIFSVLIASLLFQAYKDKRSTDGSPIHYAKEQVY